MFQRIGAAAYKADLGNTIALIEILGHPEQKFRSVHIAGTNGKGSVAHILASILQESGYKTGLYTSPHLKDFRERIRINGNMIPKGHVTQFVDKHKKAFRGIHPSFFEYTAVMAFDYFAKEVIDIAVLETGMGGRLDSTNVVTPLVSVITNISFDHTAFLGNTLPLIAAEKAGIIKDGIPVIIGETQTDVKEVFVQKASEQNSQIHFADEKFIAKKSVDKEIKNSVVWNILENGKIWLEGLKYPLKGNYQAKNLSTAVMVVEELNKQGFSISPEIVRQGLKNAVKNTGLQGRWQIIGMNPRIICDVGHNEAGIRYILDQLTEEKFRTLHWVFGMVSDKEAESILRLLPSSARYYFCKANIPRGRNAEEVKHKAAKFNLKGEAYNSVKEAFEAAKKNASGEDLILIAGSTFVVAEVL